MNLNNLIFPAPKPTYTDNHPDLYWIAKDKPKRKGTQKVQVPFLFIRNQNHYDRVLIYFHGNSEDINLAYNLAEYLSNKLQVI